MRLYIFAHGDERDSPWGGNGCEVWNPVFKKPLKPRNTLNTQNTERTDFPGLKAE